MPPVRTNVLMRLDVRPGSSRPILGGHGIRRITRHEPVRRRIGQDDASNRPRKLPARMSASVIVVYWNSYWSSSQRVQPSSMFSVQGL